MQKQISKLKINLFLKFGLIGALIFLILSVIVSYSLMKFNVNSSFYFPLLMFISFFTGTTTGFAGLKVIKQNGLINGIFVSIIPAIIIQLLMIIANKGFTVNQLIIVCVCLAGGAVGGLMGVNIKKKNKFKRRK